MAKRLLDDKPKDNIINKKIKLDTDYDKWNDIIHRIREKLNVQRKIIEKKYELTDFTDKEDIDHRIHYGGVNGDHVFQEMYQKVISVELELFFKYVLKATKPNSVTPLVKSPICHSLLKLLGTERKKIAKLTKTYKYHDFGMLAMDYNKYDYLCDEISVWPKWHSMFLRKMKCIFETYECVNTYKPIIILDNQPIKYLLKNKRDSSKVLSFIVLRVVKNPYMRVVKNTYKCHLMAGDKTLDDFKGANLSSVILTWISHAKSGSDIYPLIMANIIAFP